MLNVTPKLKTLISDLWSRFWAGGISNPITAIEQISYLLFMRKLDEIDSSRRDAALRTGGGYISPFSKTYKPENDLPPLFAERLRWSEFKKLPQTEMLDFVQSYVFPFTKSFGVEGSTFARHMENAIFLIPSASLLANAVSDIDRIYAEIEKDAADHGHLFQDIQGDVYEYLLKEISTSGKNGQFRTPRHVIKLVTELVSPKLHSDICDPACGTGGFLVDCYHYLMTQSTIARSLKRESDKLDEDGFLRIHSDIEFAGLRRSDVAKTLFGFDIDSTMVRLGSEPNQAVALAS